MAASRLPIAALLCLLAAVVSGAGPRRRSSGAAQHPSPAECEPFGFTDPICTGDDTGDALDAVALLRGRVEPMSVDCREEDEPRSDAGSAKPPVAGIVRPRFLSGTVGERPALVDVQVRRALPGDRTVLASCWLEPSGRLSRCTLISGAQGREAQVQAALASFRYRPAWECEATADAGLVPKRAIGVQHVVRVVLGPRPDGGG